MGVSEGLRPLLGAAETLGLTPFPALHPRKTMDIISLWRSSGAQPRRKAGDNPFHGYEVLHSGENDKSEDDNETDNQNDSESHDSFLPQCVWQP